MSPKELRNILSSDFDFSQWKIILERMFSKIDYFTRETIIEVNLIKSGGQVGNIRLDDGRSLALFVFEVADNIIISRNRKGLRDIAAHYVDQHIIHGAWVFYYSKSQVDYRLSFVAKQTTFNTYGELITNETAPKRYTFLLGRNEKCTTASNRLFELIERKEIGLVNLVDVTEAFSVERLNKEFFTGYKVQYNKFLNTLNKEDRDDRDYVKKLLGRLVFLQFLQKKGWMGVPINDDNWNDGDKNYLSNLVDRYDGNNRLLSDVLEPLFFDTLNKPRNKDKAGAVLGYNIKIPYLNGGLFDKDSIDKENIDFPYEYFADLMDFFASYNFTIDENDPNDAEVGVDPEMLGRVFENLLEDNKDKGAFYTPKEIVQYMCRESLIAYLQTDVNDDQIKDSIRQFVTTYDASVLSEELKATVDQKLKDVKICDPAIGSGAFPMGLLRELYACRKAIEGIDEETAVSIKTHIIQNNIYGVDIEKGAVDIARLRFWLALIVDEKNPHALPNMDFKIMQGNSLLEQYEGVELSGMSLDEQKKRKAKKGQAWQATLAFDEKYALDNIQHAIKEYYLTDDHNAKLSLRSIINENVRSYIINLKGCTADVQKKIEKLPIPNNQFFLWHIYFKEVFDKGGFDIVIGNPPYIDSETMVKVMPKERELYSKKFACASGNWDMFIVFIEFSISMLKENGIFSNIIPNKLIAAKYGVELRKHLSNKHVLEIRDYSRIDVFEDAAVYPITIVLRNCDKKDNTLFTIMENRVDVKQSNKAKSSDLARNDYWDPFFRDTAVFNLISEITMFITLKNLPVEVLGAATVADAYEIKNIVQDSNSKEGFKLINSGTIDPYLPYWGIKPCRYIKGSYTYPIVPAEDLKNYSEVRYTQASSPKIIVASMTTRYEACLDVIGEYIAGKSTTIILGDAKQLYKLTAIINSKLASYWLNIVFNSLKMSGGAINIGRNELQILPIPDKGVDFKTLVNNIIERKASSSLNDTTEIEHEIDLLVYELYGLTEDEIKIVEGTK